MAKFRAASYFYKPHDYILLSELVKIGGEFDSSLSIITLCMAVFFFHELNHRCYEPAKCCPVMLTCWECKNSTECCSAECQSENLLEQTVFLLFCMSELTLWWVSASESLGIS